MRKIKPIRIVLICLVAAIISTIVFNVFGCNNHTNNNAIGSIKNNVSTPAPTPIIINESSTPYVPVYEDNESYFESGWYMLNTDGEAYGDFTYNNMNINVVNVASALTSCSLYRDGVALIKGNSYTISFNATSDIDRKIQLAVINQDTGSVINTTDFNISTENTYTASFSMPEVDTYNGRVIIYFGNDGNENTKNVHNITINSLKVINESTQDGVVKVNQVGYLPLEAKRCIFPYDTGDYFDVIDKQTGQIVYTGAIVRRIDNPQTGEADYYGDFSNLTTPGEYYIRSQVNTSSYDFRINDDVYDALGGSLMNMLYGQRCGQDLDESIIGQLAHPMCHTGTAIIYGTETTVEVNGGWHDAGDYGRYVKTGTKAANDLLFTYLTNPGTYENLLEEARYELDWLLKMQDQNSGGVYTKVMTQSFPNTVMPQDNNEQLYVMPIETTATGDFAATMAYSYLIYKNSDKEYANKCLEASKKAFDYLLNNPNIIEGMNPTDFTGGEYTDSKDLDERFNAAISLYAVTDDESYLNYAKEYFNSDNLCANGTTWKSQSGYGRYLYLMTSTNKDDQFYTDMKNSLISEAEGIVGQASGDGYFTSLASYEWGSNGYVSDNALILMMAYDVTNNVSYRGYAGMQLNYLLGCNSLNMSMVSGTGIASPQDVHSRVAKCQNTVLNGALVGGPNASREDNITQAMGEEVPAAKVYADSYDSYSTNEISIYWNSSLIHLLAKLRP